MKYTIVILIATTEKWLRLSRKDRAAFVEKDLQPIIIKYSATVSVRMFDSESSHPKHTDFLIIETSSLRDYYHFWEEIRDSKIYTEPYFIVNEIVTGQENAFREFEETAGYR